MFSCERLRACDAREGRLSSVRMVQAGRSNRAPRTASPSVTYGNTSGQLSPKVTPRIKIVGRGIFEGVEEGGTPWVFAYFQGVLDWAAMMEAEGESVTGFEEPMATR